MRQPPYVESFAIGSIIGGLLGLLAGSEGLALVLDVTFGLFGIYTCAKDEENNRDD